MEEKVAAGEEKEKEAGRGQQGQIGHGERVIVSCRRAGHFRFFFIFSMIKKDFSAFFNKCNNLITFFCTSAI